VRWLSRLSSKLSNYPKMVHRDVTAAQLLTHVANSSRCEVHIINPLQHQKEHIQTVKTEDSMKSIGGSQRMKSDSTKASDQESKLSDLMTCSEAYDDTTYVTRVRGPIATVIHEVEHNPNQESHSDTCLIGL
jgi:hypothetical protein